MFTTPLPKPGMHEVVMVRIGPDRSVYRCRWCFRYESMTAAAPCPGDPVNDYQKQAAAVVEDREHIWRSIKAVAGRT